MLWGVTTEAPVSSGKTLADYEARNGETRCACCRWRLLNNAATNATRRGGLCMVCWHGEHRPECPR
jgi:hypothetical protein